MDFIRRVRIEIERLRVVEEFVKNGATVIEFPGDGFFGFFMNATTSYSLSSAHLENKKRDVGLFLYSKKVKIGDTIAISVAQHPLTGKPGFVTGTFHSVHYMRHGAHENIPFLNIVPDGLTKDGLERSNPHSDAVAVAFEDIITIFGHR